MQVRMNQLLTKVNVQKLLEEEEKSGRNLQQQLRQQLANVSSTVPAEELTANQQVGVDLPCSGACSVC